MQAVGNTRRRKQAFRHLTQLIRASWGVALSARRLAPPQALRLARLQVIQLLAPPSVRRVDWA
jgi:hypothetical protein